MRKIYLGVVFGMLFLGCRRGMDSERTTYGELHAKASQQLAERYINDFTYRGFILGVQNPQAAQKIKQLVQLSQAHLDFVEKAYKDFVLKKKLPETFRETYLDEIRNIGFTVSKEIPPLLAREIEIPTYEQLTDADTEEQFLAKAYTNAVALTVYCHRATLLFYDPVEGVMHNGYKSVLFPIQKDTFASGYLLPYGRYLQLNTFTDLAIDSVYTDGRFKAHTTGPNPKASFVYYDPKNQQDITYEVAF